ncbi:MAG: cysteine--tRNA ligase [Thermoleophilia bacterium]|nr:cysteine--tRNA ligase [Thermoleophilia bacterium]MDH3724399.1 cysteine--tRNA ligase [Thermoleophilia bacterium]
MSEAVAIYSTLSKQKEPVTPGPEGVVRIYACGPTVYGRVHIGNARPYIVFSVLKRFLERRGMRTLFVSNLTDVNDKIYVAAREQGISSSELAENCSEAYVEDTDRLGLGRPDLEPRVTESMPEIIDVIQTLVDKGLAYAAGGDVYFRVDRFARYGALSGRDLDEMVSNEPGEGKENPLDFALWKGRKPDEDTWWESPWGDGRPGWHIECSAMSVTALGRDFEIHGGGLDLAFPHHENEIAQSEGATDERMAQIWMHNEMLELSGDKMSKSVGNIALLHEVLDEWPAEVVLAYFLRAHYRSKLPFSDAHLADAAEVCERIRNGARAIDRAMGSPGEATNPQLARALVAARRDFYAALDDDFGTPGAFAALFDLIRAINQAVEGDRPTAGQLQEVRRELVEMLDVFGLAGLAKGEGAVPAEVIDLLAEREAARDARDFERADVARDQILELGFELRDTPEGPQVYPR